MAGDSTLPFESLVSADQLSPDVLLRIFAVAEQMQTICDLVGRTDLLSNRIVALLFFEPSSRTILSFQSAVQRLGAGVIYLSGREMASLDKGESLADTMRVVSGYCDLVIMRHDEAGSAAAAAGAATVPFINAGDGGNEHPTQALLDAWTILREKGRLEDLHVAFGFDPRHSRTIHSLARLLSQYDGARFTFVSPDGLRAPPDLLALLDERGVRVVETDRLDDGLDADVIYVNRLQRERFSDATEFERHRRTYALDADMLAGRDATVLDPLPRVDEIAPSVDELPNAAYFRQVRNGLPIRMALVAMMLGRGVGGGVLRPS